jgi:hypothetical protein
MSKGVTVGKVICTKATPKAILVRLEDGKETWVPQSQVHDDSEVWKEGHSGKLVVESWFAEQKGWN